MKTNDIVVIAVIAIVAIMAFGGNPFAIFSSGGGDDGNKQVIEIKNPDKACAETTMAMDFVEKYNEGTDMTAQNGTVYVNGQLLGTYSEGSTFTANGGDTLDIYYALDPASTSYYASHAHGVIPCTGATAAKTTSADFMQPGDLAGQFQNPPSKLYKSSTAASVSVYNKKTLAANPGTAISIGAGGKETARIYISWDFEEGYGVADGNTLACRFTDANIDQAETTASLDGQMLGSAKYIPSGTRFALSQANQSAKYWSFPPIDARNVDSSVLDITIAGDQTQEPVGATNFSCEIIDTDLFQYDSGGVGVGIEDADDNSNVGRSSEVKFTLLLG